MRTLWQALLWVWAGATKSELVRQVQFLKVENDILRAKLPRRVSITAAERRRLIKFGQPLGAALRQLISIVSPRRFFRWLHGDQKKKVPTKLGRPRTGQEVRELVLRLARENAWGYTRIFGELKKLGIAGISRSTVANILRAEGFDPGPKRGADTWNGWVERHARTLWACDFLSKKVWTWRGLVEHFVFFFIHIGSRRVQVAGITTNPTEIWVAACGQEMGKVWETEPDQPAFLIRDLDSKFGRAFDKEMKNQGIEVVPVGPRAPNLNAHAERFVQSVKSECLDHFTVFGEKHLRFILSEFVEHYHEEHPHQGLGNKPLADTGQPPPIKGKIRCRKRLGGLLKHYHRQAA